MRSVLSAIKRIGIETEVFGITTKGHSDSGVRAHEYKQEVGRLDIRNRVSKFPLGRCSIKHCRLIIAEYLAASSIN
jgi:hypothetical protein